MPNSDNAYGTFNKRTQILSQIDDGSTALVNHASVDAAKSFFYTAEALAVFDECCTRLEWAIVDSTKLKYTMTFGTKGGNIAAADDWAETFNSRKTALINSDRWANGVVYNTEESFSHLF